MKKIMKNPKGHEDKNAKLKEISPHCEMFLCDNKQTNLFKNWVISNYL